MTYSMRISFLKPASGRKPTAFFQRSLFTSPSVALYSSDHSFRADVSADVFIFVWIAPSIFGLEQICDLKALVKRIPAGACVRPVLFWGGYYFQKKHLEADMNCSTFEPKRKLII